MLAVTALIVVLNENTYERVWHFKATQLVELHEIDLRESS
jgi:hypothetical protein